MLERKIKAALNHRDATLAQCPIANPMKKRSDVCPKCYATPSQPCWIKSRADNVFIQTVEELLK